MSRLSSTRRVILRSTAAVPLAGLGIACGQEAAPQPSKVGPATIRFAYSAEQNEIVHFDKIVEIVKQKVPQLSVTSEVYGAGTAAVYAQILVLWAAGNAPDITQISPNNIPSFIVKSGGLAVIDDLVKRDKHDIADFWPR